MSNNGASNATTSKNAVFVGAGIVFSRISGIIRESFFAAYLGTRSSADAFSAALRIPKLLQNLLGEGALTASFIPVYSQVLQSRNSKLAGQVAGAMAGLLTAVTGALVLLAILAARPLAAIVAPGFTGQKYELTVYLIRIVSGGIGFLVLSAWCLGILNSHRRFFLSYVAPVLWNTAIIVALAVAGILAWAEANIAEAAAWGVLIGGGLQLLVQLPAVLRLTPDFTLSLNTHIQAVRETLRRFLPAVVGRGAVTLGTYADLFLASLLATGAVAILDRAQVLYLLPISVFAVSIAAADLPELSRTQAPQPYQTPTAHQTPPVNQAPTAHPNPPAHAPTQRDFITRQLLTSADRMLLFLLFSAVAFITLGQLIVSALYERLNFNSDDTLLVWWVLGIYSLSLVATGLSRLMQNIYYATGNVSIPARISLVRLVVSVVIGLVLMFQFDRIVVDGGALYSAGSLPAFTPLDSTARDSTELRHLGPLGLAFGSMLGALVELGLLRQQMRRLLGRNFGFRGLVRRLLPAGVLASVTGILLAWSMRNWLAIPSALLALLATGGVYLLAANVAGHRTSRAMFRPLRLMIWKR